jgi:hypothetical protein
MPGRWNGWLALTWAERGQLLLISVALPLIHAAVAIFGYQRTQAWLERRSQHTAAHAASETDLHAAARLAQLAAIAGRHGAISATCLRQSLLIYWILRRRGLQPVVRLGVRKQPEDALDAHAWVELDGHPLSSTPIQHQPFDFPDHKD